MWLIIQQFEDGATAIRDVSLIQALLLTEEIGLWSGNRRRMELAQSHFAIPVTVCAFLCATHALNSLISNS